MSLYVYIKETNATQKKVLQYVSYMTLTAGSLLLFWAFYPVVSFEIYSRLFMQRSLKSPVPQTQIASSLELASGVLGTNAIFSNNLSDFTHASLWFPTKKMEATVQPSSVKEYSLSIPKLNIQDAKVLMGGEDLTRGLVHYLPVTLPGEKGNSVIFGHSTLPQLYNVKDYKTIFTYLPSLNKGDHVIAKVGDVSYEYEVYEMFVVKPDQVSVLEQLRDSSILTLITCVPPGTYWNRLVVRAKLTTVPTQL